MHWVLKESLNCQPVYFMVWGKFINWQQSWSQLTATLRPHKTYLWKLTILASRSRRKAKSIQSSIHVTKIHSMRGFFFCVFWRLSTALLTKYSLSYIVSLQCPSGNCPENYWQDTALQGKKSPSCSEPQDGSQYWSLRHNIPGVRSVNNIDFDRW